MLSLEDKLIEFSIYPVCSNILGAGSDIPGDVLTGVTHMWLSHAVFIGLDKLVSPFIELPANISADRVFTTCSKVISCALTIFFIYASNLYVNPLFTAIRFTALAIATPIIKNSVRSILARTPSEIPYSSWLGSSKLIVTYALSAFIFGFTPSLQLSILTSGFIYEGSCYLAKVLLPSDFLEKNQIQPLFMIVSTIATNILILSNYSIFNMINTVVVMISTPYILPVLEDVYLVAKRSFTNMHTAISK